jgi:acyl dehydratase
MQTFRFNNVQDLEAAVGTHLGTSDWFEIDQPRVNQFAEATLDDQWIHVDPVRAAAGPFGTTIGHGFLTLSLIPYIIGDLIGVAGLEMELNYGLNRVRFPSPLPVGSRVRADVELVEVTPGARGVQAVYRVTVTAEGATKPAVVADWVLLYVP